VGGLSRWFSAGSYPLVVTMDVILKVLEGAKTGTKVAVKKDEFLIGRSQKCHLCAGSSSVSRRHCAITRSGTTVSIKDLGSRNGTLVNGQKITGEVELASGDEIAVGSLKFLMTITPGISNLKRPKVKTVAEAAERTAASEDSSVAEDDITQWLLDTPSKPPQTMNETQTIQMDDTNAIHLKKMAEQQESPQKSDNSSATQGASITEELPEEEQLEEETHSKQAKSKKKKPGKLPPLPSEPDSKDSREAAMQALRNWNRRR